MMRAAHVCVSVLLAVLSIVGSYAQDPDDLSQVKPEGAGNAPVEAFSFGFWTSILQCENPAAKPRLTFNKVMRCGCAKDGKPAGACTDLGQEVLNLANNQVLKIDKELKAPSPPFNGPCQQLPQVFLDSGTADSGANFDELWDAAMGSPCAYDPNLEWMGRDCRDSFIPGKGAEGDPSVQDRSDPSRVCTLECATLYLKVAELCPRVYQLLRLDQLKPICPELASVMIEPLPGGPVPIDGSVAPVTTAVVPAPAVAPVVPAVAVAPVPVAEVPAVAPVAVAEVPAVVAAPPTGPVVVAVAPQPAPSASSALSSLSLSAVSVLVCVCSWMAALL